MGLQDLALAGERDEEMEDVRRVLAVRRRRVHPLSDPGFGDRRKLKQVRPHELDNCRLEVAGENFFIAHAADRHGGGLQHLIEPFAYGNFAE